MWDFHFVIEYYKKQGQDVESTQKWLKLPIE